MHRFFVSPQARTEGRVRLEGAQARQIARVLRLTPGEQIAVLDGRGAEWLVMLTAVTPVLVEGNVIAERQAAGEPRLRLTLVQAILKADHFAWVLQKGTETGVTAFVPVATRRSIVPLAAAAGKHDRWASIVREAAEQSHRGVIPALAPVQSFADALKNAPEPVFLLWEEEQAFGLRAALERCGPLEQATIVVGPEGGLTGEEAASARALGAVTVSLGPRILRAETAGIVAAAAIMFHYGELGG